MKFSMRVTGNGLGSEEREEKERVCSLSLWEQQQ